MQDDQHRDVDVAGVEEHQHNAAQNRRAEAHGGLGTKIGHGIRLDLLDGGLQPFQPLGSGSLLD